MSARDLLDDAAILDDEDDDESFDEETGEVKPKANGINGHFDDSSEEDEEDDEEEAAKVSTQCQAKRHHHLCSHLLLSRLRQGSFSTKRKRMMKLGLSDGVHGRKGNASNESVKTRALTKKTLTSSALAGQQKIRQSPNSNA